MPTQDDPLGTAPPVKSPLADPSLRRLLEDFVRRRVPAPDVDDVVQTILLDALASQARPSDAEELRKWLLGIARHKVVDHHRRAVREPPTELPDIEAGPDLAGDIPEARSLARWAEEQAAPLGDAQKTLAWMAREGEGEKLESIAAEENVPPARVRQRVSRMRRWMKERWLAELAAVAVLGVLLFIAWRLLRRPGDKEMPEARPDEPKPVPSLAPSIAPEAPTPLERARTVRADALRKCEGGLWRPCLDGLDEAALVDPEGDSQPGVAAARERAKKALQEEPLKDSVPPPQVPAPSPTLTSVPPAPSPFSTAAPRPTGATPSVKPPSPVTTTPFGGKPTSGGASEKAPPRTKSDGGKKSGVSKPTTDFSLGDSK